MKLHTLDITNELPGGLLRFMAASPVLAPFRAAIFRKQGPGKAADLKKPDSTPAGDGIPDAEPVGERAVEGGEVERREVEGAQKGKEEEIGGAGGAAEEPGHIFVAVDRKRISAVGIDFAALDGERCFAVDGSIDGITSINAGWKPPQKWNLLVRKRMAGHLAGLGAYAVEQKHLMKRDPTASEVEFRFILDNPQLFTPNTYNAGMLAEYATKWKRYIPSLPPDSTGALEFMKSSPVFVIISVGRIVASATTLPYSDKEALICGAYTEPQFAIRDYRAACIESLCLHLEQKGPMTIHSIVDIKDYLAMDDFRKAGFSRRGDLVLYRI